MTVSLGTPEGTKAKRPNWPISRLLGLSLAAALGLLPLGTRASNWIGPSGGNWSTAGNWSPSGAPMSSGQTADIPTAVAVNLDASPSIASLAIDSSGGTLNILTNRSLQLGGLTNNGTIIVDSPASSANESIVFSSPSSTLSGTGNIILNAPANSPSYAYINTIPGMSLTQAAGHTISGQGTVSAALINQGLINANVSGQTLVLSGSSKTNAATMEATAGGVLSVQTSITNTGGTILAGGGNVQLGNFATITGGTLASTGASNIQINAPGATLAGATLSPGTLLNLPGGQTMTITGGLADYGTLVVDSNAAASSAGLTFNGSQTLSGSGNLVLNAPAGLPADAHLDISGGTVTQAAGHTISGQGKINGPWINQGVINANQNGQSLMLTMGNIANSGTLEATAGGVLAIQEPVNNTGGTILVSGGSIQFNTSAMITGGTLTSTGSSSFQAVTNALNGVTLSPGTLLNVPSGQSPSIGAGLVNNGTIIVNSTQGISAAQLSCNGGETISGSGSIVLNAPGGGYGAAGIFTGGTGTLTQAAGHTICGTGQISGMPFVNQGLVNANVNGQWLGLFGTVTNSATMEATAGGILVAGTVNNAGGTLLADGGSILLNTGTVTGGTLTSTSPSSCFQVNGNANLNAAVLSPGTQLNIADGEPFTIGSGLVNNGTIVLDSGTTTNGAAMYINGSQTLSGSGSLILNQSNRALVMATGPNMTLTQAAGHTISGQGQILLPLVNQGLVNANVLAQAIVLFGSTATNSATMEATAGGILAVGTVNNSGGTLLADGGLVFLGAGTVTGGTLTSTGYSSFQAYGSSTTRPTLSGVVLSQGTQLNLPDVPADTSLTLAGGVVNNGTIAVDSNQSNNYVHLYVSGNQTLSGSGSLVLNLAGYASIDATTGTPVLTQAATHTISGQGTVTVALSNLGTVQAQGGPLTLTAPVTQFSGSTLTGGTWIASANSTLNVTSAGSILTNQATVVLDGPGSSFPNINSLASNQGSFTVRGGRSFTTAGALANSGIVTVGSGSTLTVAGTYTPSAGSITAVDGLLVLSGATNVQGTLTGGGTAQGSLTIAGSGILAPGDSPGTLTVVGNLALANGATYNWSIGASAEDLVHVTGNLSFGAVVMVNVSLDGGALPAAGDYPLFTVGGNIGALPAWLIHLPSGWTAGGVTTVGNEVVLSALAPAPTPEPSTLALLAAGAAGLAAFAWRRRKSCR